MGDEAAQAYSEEAVTWALGWRYVIYQWPRYSSTPLKQPDIFIELRWPTATAVTKPSHTNGHLFPLENCRYI
jgi:hypothetical protein